MTIHPIHHSIRPKNICADLKERPMRKDLAYSSRFFVQVIHSLFLVAQLIRCQQPQSEQPQKQQQKNPSPVFHVFNHWTSSTLLLTSESQFLVHHTHPPRRDLPAGKMIFFLGGGMRKCSAKPSHNSPANTARGHILLGRFECFVLRGMRV